MHKLLLSRNCQHLCFIKFDPRQFGSGQFNQLTYLNENNSQKYRQNQMKIVIYMFNISFVRTQIFLDRQASRQVSCQVTSHVTSHHVILYHVVTVSRHRHLLYCMGHGLLYHRYTDNILCLYVCL